VFTSALDATAPLWPELVIAHGWLDEAAQILANPDGANSATVQARYALLLADLPSGSGPNLRVAADGGGICQGHRQLWNPTVPLLRRGGLPRTNNDWNNYLVACAINCAGRPARRTPASLVVCGVSASRPPVASRTHRFTAAELVPSNLERWRAKRTLLEQRRLRGFWAGGFDRILKPTCSSWKRA